MDDSRKVEDPSDIAILIVGTGDTKSAELLFIAETVRQAGGRPVMMDVSILKDPPYVPDYSRFDIAESAGVSMDDIIHSGDENTSMALMAKGAMALAERLYLEDEIRGTVLLGGSMGTDLALDVAAVLPLGVPKLLISTIAHSHLLPPERISPDLMTILWSGGLYGLNEICRCILSQAAGAIVGAARHGCKPRKDKPLVGMTSLGSSCLSYMKILKPALEARGYDVAVFHSTGMGGRAFEAIAAKRGFAAVMDFCIQEVSNHHHGTVVTSGADRLENAGLAGIPQIVAPGAIDMIDLPAWQVMPAHFADRPYHVHNRLLGSVTSTVEKRRELARLVAEKLMKGKGPRAFLLPLTGVQEWDRAGEPLHDPDGHIAFIEEISISLPDDVHLERVDAHINAPEFAERALAIFDAWVAEGVIPKGQP
ncbi:Tm-1-like ATP-binding domain-containing protein [Rhizobium sp. CSW-27]|uniref:Tm-1-like ATP-binding domain-containing protein n=1 Tax=Rhizobium sp. CSW-27 TaxID=2839985 RepID=UPI001C0205CD|nr:Tm-1-like ATP-binding domain-containing protein [Rhizobium sp. CSW-27]MBT9370006.1 Tm-1-like ATP-binding domain-containing protein [Rhizobium sp. CSW-27]